MAYGSVRMADLLAVHLYSLLCREIDKIPYNKKAALKGKEPLTEAMSSEYCREEK